MNRSILTVVVALVLALLGGVLWLTLGETPNSETSVAPKAVTESTQIPTAPELDPVAELPTPTSSGEDRRAIVAHEDDAKLDAVASSAAKSTQVLTGIVQSAAGAPVAGARVVVSSGGMGLDLFFAFDAAPSELARNRYPEARTDEQGRFRVVGVSAGPQSVAVRAEKFAPHDVSGVVVPTSADYDMGVIVIDAGGVLSGRVVDRRGAPIEGAHLERVLESKGGFLVFAGGNAPGVEVATSAADGSFLIDTLPSGAFKLRVWHERYPDATFSSEIKAPGQHLAPENIVLDDGRSISGRVVGIPSGLAGELSVRASPKRGTASGLAFEADLEFDIGSSSGGEARSSKVGADGSFEVQGLREGGQYTLGVRRAPREGQFDMGQRLASRTEARAGERGVEIAYRPESSLVFSVIDAQTRKPVEAMRVSAGVDFPMPIAPPAGGKRDHFEGGRVRVGDLRPRTPEERASIRIEAVGYQTHARDDLALVDGGELDLGVVELLPIPVVRVTVLDDQTGLPVAAARVTLRKVREESPRDALMRSISVQTTASIGETSPDEDFDFNGFDEDSSRTARTDEDGLARVSSLEGSRCELAVSHGKYAPYSSEAFVCSAGGGDERVVRLRKGGGARVKLLSADNEPIAGGRVERRTAAQADSGEVVFGGGANTSAVADADGVAVFERLAPGLHEFRPANPESAGFYGGGGATVMIAGMGDDEGAVWRSAEIVDGEVVELTLVAPRKVSLSGLVRESGEVLSGARLTLDRKQSGDRPRLPRMPFGGGPEVRSDGRGAYEFKDVEPGDYVLTVSHAKRSMDSEFEVRVLDHDTRFDVSLSLTIVEGRIVGSDGRPLSGVRVTAERDESGPQPRATMRMVFATSDGGLDVVGGSGAGAEDVFTDADGRYSLRGVATGAPIVVRAESGKLQPGKSEPFQLAENEVRRGVDLMLSSAGQLKVTAFDTDGAPATMAVVIATPEGDLAQTAERKSGFLRDGGETTLDGLAPGTWKVSVRPVGLGASGGAPPAPQEQVVQIKADELSTLRFDLP